MKKENALKKVLTISVIVLICLVSFVGIFVKKGYNVEKVLPDYIFGMDYSPRMLLSLQIKADEESTDNEKDAENDETIENTISGKIISKWDLEVFYRVFTPGCLETQNTGTLVISDNKYLQIDIVMTSDGPSLNDISTCPNYQEFQLLSLLNHQKLIKDIFN